MNIAELNNKKCMADKAIEKARNASDNANAVIKILQDAKVDKDTIDSVREKVNQTAIAQNALYAEVCNYGYLLDEIIRNTDIPWPPKCTE